MILFYAVCGLLGIGGWWVVVRITAHAWRGPKHWQGRARPVDPIAALVTQALAPPPKLDRTLMQPAVNIAPAAHAPRDGGLCVVGHYIEPRYMACSMGHKFNEARTVASSRAEIESAATAHAKAVREATEVRAAGAPW
jgi:hypothetical protein